MLYSIALVDRINPRECRCRCPMLLLYAVRPMPGSSMEYGGCEVSDGLVVRNRNRITLQLWYVQHKHSMTIHTASELESSHDCRCVCLKNKKLCFERVRMCSKVYGFSLTGTQVLSDRTAQQIHRCDAHLPIMYVPDADRETTQHKLALCVEGRVLAIELSQK